MAETHKRTKYQQTQATSGGPTRAHLGAALDSDGGVRLVGEGVDTDRQGALGRQHPRYLSLVLGRRLPDQARVVDQAVLGSVVLSVKKKRTHVN